MFDYVHISSVAQTNGRTGQRMLIVSCSLHMPKHLLKAVLVKLRVIFPNENLGRRLEKNCHVAPLFLDDFQAQF